jgi:peptidoglycan hydrolase-like protein with peptidoglycan-binding domain
MAHKLYPPWLNAGSEGSAVADLQLRLNALLTYYNLAADLFEGIFPIPVSGKYDSSTRVAVSALQGWLGFSGADADGHFGQGTRRLLADRIGVDFNSIPATPGQGTLWFGPDHKAGDSPSKWPELTEVAQ